MDLRIIALGAGVQSSTLYRMAALGELTPKPDVAIFADTQSEPPWVYENLSRLEADHGALIPILRATAGNLEDHVRESLNTSGGRFASVPFWTQDGRGNRGAGRRQCTREFKIDVIVQTIRRQLELKSGERAAGRYRVEEWVGISLDEAHRAKPSRTSWITTRWPLLFDKPMRRGECLRWLTDHGFPIPGKSACTFCPYRGVDEWLRWKREEPELFEQACQVDDAIRDGGTGEAEQFVWDRLRPLRSITEADSKTDTRTLDLFGNECEGMCGV